jgi:cyclophilin family peptidyl-prolyl cis-trans isomerase
VNNGPNSNGTQFFLTLCHDGQKKLDTRHCCFGRVVRGMTAFQRAIKRCYISGTNVLSSTVVIADCGEVEEMPPLVPSDEE